MYLHFHIRTHLRHDDASQPPIIGLWYTHMHSGSDYFIQKQSEQAGACCRVAFHTGAARHPDARTFVLICMFAPISASINVLSRPRPSRSSDRRHQPDSDLLRIPQVVPVGHHLQTGLPVLHVSQEKHQLPFRPLQLLQL